MNEMEEFDQTLTKAELEAESILDWPDEKLGRFVRLTATRLAKGEYSNADLAGATAAGYLLINAARKANAEKLTITLEGHSIDDIHTGDWRITVKNINKPG